MTDNVSSFGRNQSTDHLTGAHHDETITREETIIKTGKPSLFTRMKTAMENNPIKTAVGASVAIGAAAFSGVNYNRYGSPLGPNTVDGNDLREVVVAGAQFIASIR